MRVALCASADARRIALSALGIVVIDNREGRRVKIFIELTEECPLTPSLVRPSTAAGLKTHSGQYRVKHPAYAGLPRRNLVGRSATLTRESLSARSRRKRNNARRCSLRYEECTILNLPSRLWLFHAQGLLLIQTLTVTFRDQTRRAVLSIQASAHLTTPRVRRVFLFFLSFFLLPLSLVPSTTDPARERQPATSRQRQ